MAEPEKKKAELKITGMHCATCAVNIEESLSQLKDVEKAQVNLSSTPSTAVYEIPYQGKTIVAVDVAKATSGPMLSQGAALMRVGSNISPITPERVVSFVPATTASTPGVSEKIDQLARTISEQSVRFEDLRTELVKASGWRRKVLEWILSGIIGGAS